MHPLEKMEAKATGPKSQRKVRPDAWLRTWLSRFLFRANATGHRWQQKTFARVYPQVVLMQEGFTSVTALVGELTPVGAQVVGQVNLLRKGPAAVTALMWALARVCP